MPRDFISEPTRERPVGHPILCSKCGLSGGTLKKDGKGGYCHPANDIKCKLMQRRRKVKGGLER